MISWQVWQALLVPFISHPLFWLERRPEPEPLRLLPAVDWEKYRHVTAGSVAVLVVVVVVLFGPAPLLFVIIGVPLAVLTIGVPLVLLSAGTVYGLLAALTISDAIAKEKHGGRYTLLALTPRGLPVATWAIASVALHDNRLLEQYRTLLSWTYVVVGSLVGLPMLFGMMMLVLAPGEATTPGTLANGVLTGTLLVGLPFVDYYQSSTVGALLGMIAPALTAGRGNTRGYTLLLFLALQSGTYLLIGFIALLLYRELSLVFALLCLGVALLIREALIVALWFTLARTLNSDLRDLNAVIRLKMPYLR